MFLKLGEKIKIFVLPLSVCLCAKYIYECINIQKDSGEIQRKNEVEGNWNSCFLILASKVEHTILPWKLTK